MDIINSDGSPTRQLFMFLKYNKIVEEIIFSPSDELVYNEFCKMWNELIRQLSNQSSPSAMLGGLASMFGFKRHYCSTCGQPIIGRFSKIGTMITCNPCYESYIIIQEMEEKKSIKKGVSKNGKKS